MSVPRTLHKKGFIIKTSMKETWKFINDKKYGKEEKGFA